MPRTFNHAAHANLALHLLINDSMMPRRGSLRLPNFGFPFSVVSTSCISTTNICLCSNGKKKIRNLTGLENSLVYDKKSSKATKHIKQEELSTIK
ncbi:hypothetical protein Vadar_025775 [Vaccinium darrowii]|uniref:Uncharacterized protein n=1 Tax=Vaccinium darrowii TaxID=229202 RepID=A0ACB7XCM7_9ERIC|nr:hypothetical protein Vadar_025775 [Vaccinium darrowii]